MKTHASVRRNLPVASVAARFLLVGFLIFATSNPSHYSILTWLLNSSASVSAKAVVAFGLALSWLIVLRISLAGLAVLGGLGLAYVGSALLVLALLEFQFELLRSLSAYTLVLLIEFALAAVLTFGLVFSYWVRQATGQSAVVKSPR